MPLVDNQKYGLTRQDDSDETQELSSHLRMTIVNKLVVSHYTFGGFHRQAGWPCSVQESYFQFTA
jgi:hypothetical protein